MVELTDLFDRLIQTKQELRKISVAHWHQYETFTFAWWLSIALAIVPWIVWWKS